MGGTILCKAIVKESIVGLLEGLCAVHSTHMLFTIWQDNSSSVTKALRNFLSSLSLFSHPDHVWFSWKCPYGDDRLSSIKQDLHPFLLFAEMSQRALKRKNSFELLTGQSRFMNYICFALKLTSWWNHVFNMNSIHAFLDVNMKKVYKLNPLF